MFVFICLFFVFDLRHDLNTLSPIHVLYTDARLYTCKSLGRPRLVFGNASYYEKYEDWYVRPHISPIHVMYTDAHMQVSRATETCIWKCELLRNIRRLVRPHISPIHVMCTDARLYTCKSLGRPRRVFGSASYYEKYRDWCVHTYQSTRSKSNMNSTDLLLRGRHPFF